MPAPDWYARNRDAIRQLPPVSGPAPECEVVGCGRTVHTLGLCKAHYHRARRAFDSAFVSKATRKATT